MIIELTEREARALYNVLAYGRLDIDRKLVNIENYLERQLFPDAGHEALVKTLQAPLPTYEECLRFWQK